VGQSAAFAIVVLGEEVRPKQKDAAFRKEVEEQLAQLLQEVNAELADYEKLQMVVIAQEAWSIENGCLTPTLKIRRNRIESDVNTKLDGWYAGKAKVQWA